jgi:outer membrane protein assembly factor BamB
MCCASISDSFQDNILIISYYTSDKKGDFDAETFAFDGKTGKQLWSVTTSASKMTLISPPNGHSLVLLPTQSGIVALDSVTGKQAWTYQSDAQNQWWSNVAADTDGNWYGVLGSNANGGNPLFAFSSGGSVIKSYTLDKNLICVDVVAVRGSSSFTALYAVCLPMSAPYFPKLYAVHATEGSVLWEYNYPEGQLIVGNTGKLFFFNAYDPDMQQNSELQAVW